MLLIPKLARVLANECDQKGRHVQQEVDLQGQSQKPLNLSRVGGG